LIDANPLRRLLKATLDDYHKRTGKNRIDFAEEMRARLDDAVTASKLDSFTRKPKPKKTYYLPAEWLPTVCEVGEDDRLVRAVLPDHLREALAVGELVMDSHRSLEQALALVRNLKTRGSRRTRKPAQR